MQARDFCYWLQGFFELQDGTAIKMNERQVDLVRRHLNMVFIHEIDPSMPNPALDVAHTTPSNPPVPLSDPRDEWPPVEDPAPRSRGRGDLPFGGDVMIKC